jgi:translation initiation factor IF-2
VVIEAKLDRNRGPLATVLVQNGTVRVGNYVVAGAVYGRVRAMVNDSGARIQEATPSVPVEIMGFGSLPEAGDVFQVVADDKTAKNLTEQRQKAKEMERSSVRPLTLEEVYSRINAGEVKELNLVVKADVQGSVEAVRSSLQRLDGAQAKVRILHASSGSITESDVLLASASKAIVLGFATSTQPGIEQMAEREGVEIRNYGIIYHLVEDIEKALKGILEAVFRDVVYGHAEIRVVFSVGKRGKAAGCMVSDGRIAKNTLVRVLRDKEVIHEGSIASLRHFKEDVNEIGAGFECGVGILGYTDFQEGDTLETYRKEKVSA